ncbi:uncharacterized protein [Typha angustifolia]|uniref:uncharacterized protein isoform X1 n=1 Tax=Typha angustifolia TaxID=59011 RepID=UPI003C2E2DA5
MVSSSNDESDMRTFRWRINGFASLLEHGKGWTNSRFFQINGFNWCLKVNPLYKKSDGTTRYVALRLELNSSSIQSNFVVEAVFKLVIYNQLPGEHIEKEVTHFFQTTRTVGGSSMIPLETLKSSSGFIANDSCVFGVEIKKSEKLSLPEVSETLYMQKNKKRYVYPWNIKNFFEPHFRKCRSKTFIIGGYKWHLTRYPGGRGNSEFLSLYLKFDESNQLSPNSGVFVEFSICIKDQKDSNHKILTERYHFDATNRSCGWPRFISMKDFRNPSRGFFVEEKCTIEAHITILGSSIGAQKL